MAKDVTCCDLLISCPGDIQDELQIIEEVISQFNEQFSDTTNVMVRSKHWSKSSFSESGGKPQALLNKQFVNGCDAAIAVFWTRFGTPTDKYGSGSEEEIEIMLEAGKQVFMGFCEREVKPQNIDYDQYQKVRTFREKYKDRGLYFTYSTLEEFRKTVFAHLTKFFLTKKDLDEIKVKKAPDLKIKSISDGTLCNSLTVMKFKPAGHVSKDQMIEDMHAQYSKIASYALPHKQSSNDLLPQSNSSFSKLMKSTISPLSGFIKAKQISEDVQKLLNGVAKNFKIDLPEDFYYLGDLQENSMAGFNIYGPTTSLEGTDEEKEKYRTIIALHKSIMDLIDWVPFESNYEGLSCIKLAIINEGMTYDEDIDVELQFLKGTLIWGKDIPKLSADVVKFAVDHFSLQKIFGIHQTIHFEEYDFPENKQNYAPAPVNYYPFISRDYYSDFQQKLKGVFLYDYFENVDKVHLKLHFDYLKHNNAMAFPSVIFVNEHLSNIEYSISSKHNSDVVKGTLSVSSAK